MAFSLPTGYLSASQINKYLSCPKQYEQEYVLGLRSSGGSVASTTGSCVHLLVENNLKKFIAGVPELSDITLATLSDTTLADMFKEVGDLEGESEMFWVSEAQKLFKTWYFVNITSTSWTQRRCRSISRYFWLIMSQWTWRFFT